MAEWLRTVPVDDIDPEDIIRFARTFDPQPFHTDPEAAKDYVFGGLCASGWHTCAAWMRLTVDRAKTVDGTLAGISPGIDLMFGGIEGLARLAEGVEGHREGRARGGRCAETQGRAAAQVRHAAILPSRPDPAESAVLEKLMIR